MRISNKWLRRGRCWLLTLLEGALVAAMAALFLSFFRDKGELIVDSVRWIFR